MGGKGVDGITTHPFFAKRLGLKAAAAPRFRDAMFDSVAQTQEYEKLKGPGDMDAAVSDEGHDW